jgi:transcriptional regulator with XRE-family HTH domain
MTITAKDIAERLQVSPSAVSLAMNGKPGVSEATRERIMTEAVRMGYSIHKKEISTTARNIRFVIFLSGKPNMEEDTLAPEILQGIESRAQEYGHNVLVSYFYADGDWAAQTLNICRDTAGMIVLASGMEEQHVEKARALLERQEIPVILIGNTMELSDVGLHLCRQSAGRQPCRAASSGDGASRRGLSPGTPPQRQFRGTAGGDAARPPEVRSERPDADAVYRRGDLPPSRRSAMSAHGWPRAGSRCRHILPIPM